MTDARDDLVARVPRHLEQVAARIETTGRDPTTLTIVAVAKGFGREGVAAVRHAGLRDVGENYAQELVEAHDADAGAGAHQVGADAVADVVADVDAGTLAAPLTWHFLGALQRNKLARLATRVDCYQSISSGADALAVASRAPSARCYVEVDVTGAAGRGGCARADVVEVVAAVRDAGLRVEGLMCVASPAPDAAAEQFAWLRASADALGLEGCSMGMSGDLELACRAGSTMLRLGTALLGPRPSRPPRGVA